MNPGSNVISLEAKRDPEQKALVQKPKYMCGGALWSELMFAMAGRLAIASGTTKKGRTNNDDCTNKNGQTVASGPA